MGAARRDDRVTNSSRVGRLVHLERANQNEAGFLNTYAMCDFLFPNDEVVSKCTDARPVTCMKCLVRLAMEIEE